jgi:uncharacterized protein (DUF2141 family)
MIATLATRLRRLGLICAVLPALWGLAHPGVAELPDRNSHALVAINAGPEAEGLIIRLLVYADESSFLEQAVARLEGEVGADGVAVVRLEDLAHGEYAFFAFLDVKGDGRLPRGALGRPKAPYAFSNDITPKLRRPRFSEAKVDVATGMVISLTLR